jgi:hypothetical protein
LTPPRSSAGRASIRAAHHPYAGWDIRPSCGLQLRLGRQTVGREENPSILISMRRRRRAAAGPLAIPSRGRFQRQPQTQDRNQGPICRFDIGSRSSSGVDGARPHPLQQHRLRAGRLTRSRGTAGPGPFPTT